jgi:hypothetical protein
MPPKKKKPTPRATSSARAKTPARKPSARSKTATRKPAARAKRPATPRSSERPRVALKPDEPEQSSGARPVAVGSVRALWETDEVAPPAPPPSSPAAAPPKQSPSIVDKPLAELGVGGFAALLAASVFLPWYHNAPGTVNGWASGTWGPIIFFLSVAAVAIVVLRRAGIGIAFPVEPTLVVEAIGWVCVIGLILKRYFPPKPFGFKLPTDGWIFASLAFALGLALLAGVASSNASFVLRPGWWKGTAGRIGAVVVVIALAGGLAFGFTNTAVSTAVPKIKENPPATQSKGLPPCAKRLHVPTPTGFTALSGSEVKGLNNCSVQYSSSLPLKTGFDRFVAALQGSGWTVTTGRSSAIYELASLSGRTCGTLTTAQTQPKTLVTLVNLISCSQPAPK